MGFRFIGTTSVGIWPRLYYRALLRGVITSRLGKVTYERAYYYDPEERRGYYPFDQQLGVKGGISEGVVRIVVK